MMSNMSMSVDECFEHCVAFGHEDNCVLTSRRRTEEVNEEA